MFDISGKVAKEICFGDLSLDPQKWFNEEIGDLAFKFPCLDEIPREAVFVLAKLATKGPSVPTDLVRATHLDLETVEACLEALKVQELVQHCVAGYESTASGSMLFRAIGTKLVLRKRFELKAHFEHLDRLYKKGIVVMWQSTDDAVIAEDA